MGDELVFSTAKGKIKKSKEKPASGSPTPARMRLEKKGRGGKVVTVLFDLPFDSMKTKEIKRALQAKFGCGATVKGGRIELQGDRSAGVSEWFKEQGMKILRSGG